MRILIAAVGRQRAGPEKDLVERYCKRFAKTGRGIALTGPEIIEIDESRAQTAALRKKAEAERLLAATPAGSMKVVLDEAGRALASAQLAERLTKWRDAGAPAVAFCVGGPDGHGEKLRQAADLVLSFGPMTWPHMLVRAMLAEQLYRAATILAGHPYHRD